MQFLHANADKLGRSSGWFPVWGVVSRVFSTYDRSLTIMVDHDNKQCLHRKGSHELHLYELQPIMRHACKNCICMHSKSKYVSKRARLGPFDWLVETALQKTWMSCLWTFSSLITAEQLTFLFTICRSCLCHRVSQLSRWVLWKISVKFNHGSVYWCRNHLEWKLSRYEFCKVCAVPCTVWLYTSIWPRQPMHCVFRGWYSWSRKANQRSGRHGGKS